MLKPIAAHFDGHQICLDEEIDLEPNTKLWVMVAEDSEVVDRRDWGAFSISAFAQQYENEPDIYTSEMIKVKNPDFRESE